MNPLRYLSHSVLLLAAGCALAPGTGTPEGTATLFLTPAVQDGGYRTQTEITPYAVSDVNHLVIKVFKVASDGSESEVLGSGGTPVTVDVPRVKVSQPVFVSSLKNDATYRVRAYAYGDAATASLISSDSASYVDVVVERDDRPTLATLPVRLLDRLFSGQATASAIGFGGGGFSYEGSMSIGLGSPPDPVVSSLAGQAWSQGYAEGTGTAASGNLYMAEGLGQTIRRISRQ